MSQVLAPPLPPPHLLGRKEHMPMLQEKMRNGKPFIKSLMMLEEKASMQPIFHQSPTHTPTLSPTLASLVTSTLAISTMHAGTLLPPCLDSRLDWKIMAQSLFSWATTSTTRISTLEKILIGMSWQPLLNSVATHTFLKCLSQRTSTLPKSMSPKQPCLRRNVILTSSSAMAS